MLKGFLSCFLGLFLATIGTDGITGEERYTFDTVTLLGASTSCGDGRPARRVRNLHRGGGAFQEYKGGVQYRGMLSEFPRWRCSGNTC